MEKVKAIEIDWLQSVQSDERSGSFRNPLVDLPRSFAEIGWDLGQGCVVGRIAPPEIAKAMQKQRVKFIEALSQDETEYVLVSGETEDDTVVANGAEIAKFAKALWTKDGKIATPKYQGIPCNRRGYALPASIMAYGKVHDNKSFLIPVEVKAVTTDEELWKIRMQENSNIGRTNYTIVDLVGCAIAGVRFGHSETNIRQTLGLARGKSQTVHGLATLCIKHKSLNILARLQMPKPEVDGKPVAKYVQGDWANISGFTASASRTLLGKAGKTAAGAASLDATAVKAMGFGRSKTKAVGQVATGDQVESFIKSTISGKKNADKIMDKATIETFRDQSNGIVIDLFNAILQNSKEKMAVLLDKLEALEAK